MNDACWDIEWCHVTIGNTCSTKKRLNIICETVLWWVEKNEVVNVLVSLLCFVIKDYASLSIEKPVMP